MRYLVISDVHANVQALDAVLSEAADVGYDEVLVLGDLVGYGGDPSAVLARTLNLGPITLIRGNHDKVVAGLEPATGFSGDARIAAEWTAASLTRSELATLASLPKGPRAVTGDLTICHGAPFDEDYYIFSAGDARRAMRHSPARLILFGHTHVPAVFATTDIIPSPSDANPVVRLPKRGQLIANVGSVGQPRDGDPRAAFAILDTETETLQMRRVDYDIAGAQARIREAGLPGWLADRLELGR